MIPVHATAVAVGGRAVLIEGPPGAGKSDLALRLIDRGALLVSDDRTLLSREGGTLYASAPSTIAGLIEARGVGIVRMPYMERCPVALIVTPGAPERLPEPRARVIEGVAVDQVTLALLEPSAPLKVELAMRRPPR